jgi:hypothetical protein
VSKLGLSEGFQRQIKALGARLPMWQQETGEDLGKSIRQLFDDYFRLRENVYDGLRTAQVISDRTTDVLMNALVGISSERLEKDYCLNSELLRDVLMVVQEMIQVWRQPIDKGEELSPATQALLAALADDGQQSVQLCKVPIEAFSEIKEERPTIYEKLWIVKNKHSAKQCGL